MARNSGQVNVGSIETSGKELSRFLLNAGNRFGAQAENNAKNKQLLADKAENNRRYEINQNRLNRSDQLDTKNRNLQNSSNLALNTFNEKDFKYSEQDTAGGVVSKIGLYRKGVLAEKLAVENYLKTGEGLDVASKALRFNASSNPNADEKYTSALVKNFQDSLTVERSILNGLGSNDEKSKRISNLTTSNYGSRLEDLNRRIESGSLLSQEQKLRSVSRRLLSPEQLSSLNPGALVSALSTKVSGQSEAEMRANNKQIVDEENTAGRRKAQSSLDAYNNLMKKGKVSGSDITNTLKTVSSIDIGALDNPDVLAAANYMMTQPGIHPAAVGAAIQMGIEKGIPLIGDATFADQNSDQYKNMLTMAQSLSKKLYGKGNVTKEYLKELESRGAYKPSRYSTIEEMQVRNLPFATRPTIQSFQDRFPAAKNIVTQPQRLPNTTAGAGTVRSLGNQQNTNQTRQAGNVLLTPTMVEAGKIGQNGTYTQMMAFAESSNNYNATEGNYSGKYSLGDMALQDAGLKDKNGWLNGMTREKFLASPDAQEAAFLKYSQQNEKFLEKNNVFDRIGESYKGIPLTRNGIKAAAHLLGATAVKNMLRLDNPIDPGTDGNGVKAESYLVMGNGGNMSTSQETNNSPVANLPASSIYNGGNLLKASSNTSVSRAALTPANAANTPIKVSDSLLSAYKSAGYDVPEGMTTMLIQPNTDFKEIQKQINSHPLIVEQNAAVGSTFQFNGLNNDEFRDAEGSPEKIKKVIDKANAVILNSLKGDVVSDMAMSGLGNGVLDLMDNTLNRIVRGSPSPGSDAYKAETKRLSVKNADRSEVLKNRTALRSKVNSYLGADDTEGNISQYLTANMDYYNNADGQQIAADLAAFGANFVPVGLVAGKIPAVGNYLSNIPSVAEMAGKTAKTALNPMNYVRGVGNTGRFLGGSVKKVADRASKLRIPASNNGVNNVVQTVESQKNNLWSKVVASNTQKGRALAQKNYDEFVNSSRYIDETAVARRSNIDAATIGPSKSVSRNTLTPKQASLEKRLNPSTKILNKNNADIAAIRSMESAKDIKALKVQITSLEEGPVKKAAELQIKIIQNRNKVKRALTKKEKIQEAKDELNKYWNDKTIIRD